MLARLLVLLIAGLTAAQASGQGFFGGPAAGSGGSGVRWAGSVAEATAEAKQSGKLVLLHFWSPTCGPCRTLDKHVFTQPSVASAVHDKFVPVKINATAQSDLASRYKITQVPTDIILDSNGMVIERVTSPPTPMAYVSGLISAHSRATRQAGRAYQAAVDKASHQRPALPAPEQHDGPPANSAYAHLQIPSPPKAQPSPSTTTNPYAASPGIAASPAQAKPTGEPPSVAPPVAAAAPPAHPPIGLDGCCPVTMKHARRWLPGNKEFGAVHEGRTYLFAGAAERDEFLQNYQKYAPLLSGFDPVVWIETGKKVEGKREFGMEFGESIFLFSSDESREKFTANAAGYASTLQQRLAQGAAGSVVR